MKKAKTVMIIYALIASLFITFSYSAFNSNLYISGGGVLRANVDVRVTNIVNSGYYGDAIENFNPNFNTDLTNLSVDLPTSNSYVTYTVTVENKGDPIYLTQIDLLSTVNNNVEIKISDGTTEYTLPNSSMGYFLDTNDTINYTLTIRNKNNSTNNDVLVSLKYHFVVDEVTNPIIALSNNEQNIEIVSSGSSPLGVSHYEYYVSRTNTTPAANATANGSVNGTLNISNISKLEYPQFYIWYRTVSTKGNKSEWSNNVFVSQKFTITFNYNDGVTSNTTQTISYGSNYGTLPVPPERPGYEFQGWEGNVLDIYDLTEIAKNKGLAINSNGYIYDTTPTTDDRTAPNSMGGYNNSTWYIYLTPRLYTYSINMINEATITENNIIGEDEWANYPTTSLYNGATPLYSYHLLNSSGTSTEIAIGANTNIGILLKVYDGIADVKLNAIILSSDVYKLRVNSTLTAKWTVTNGIKYTHSDDYICTGNSAANSNIINTGVSLFSNSNWQKNFYMKFEIKNDTSKDKKATPMSAKREDSSPWPGVEFRHSDSLNYFRSKATKDSNTANDITNIPASTRYVKYIRINNILYYSFDNSPWTQMLDFTGFTVQFDVPVTFCAALNAGTPFRFFNGTLSDILVEFIDENATLSDYTNLTITLNNQDATTPGTTSVNATFGSAMPSITVPTKTDYIFDGYYTKQNGRGTKYYNSSGVSVLNCGLLPNQTLYANWVSSYAAEVNGVEYSSLQLAINDGVPDNKVKTVVKLLRDINDENITISSNKNIDLNLNEFILSNTSGIVIDNSGTLEIRNGSIIRKGTSDSKRTIVNNSSGILNITSGEVKSETYQVIQNYGTMNVTGGKLWASTNVDSGIIDNENASLLNVSGGQIIAAKRQAIYNNGGTVNVSGNAYLENGYAITATRSCLQNASGTMNITGGTIISGSTNSLYAAVENNGTMTIGNNDGTIDTTSPVIKGNYYGLIIKSGNTVSYYDGIIKGLNSAIDNENNIVLDNNHNVELIHGQEIINSDTYNTVIIEETGA